MNSGALIAVTVTATASVQMMCGTVSSSMRVMFSMLSTSRVTLFCSDPIFDEVWYGIERC